MREQIKIWCGAAAIVAVYLLMCTLSDEHAARVEQCSVVHCT